MELKHYGVMGMHWGIRRYQPYPDGSKGKVFISGSSKTQTKESPYYRKKLNKKVSSQIRSYMKDGKQILVGEAPGIDSQVQDFLKKNRYKNVTVYSTGNNPRYLANKKWSTKKVDTAGYEPGSKEYNRQKDIAMTNDATEGLSIILENGGASATRNNIKRLADQNKKSKVFMLTQNNLDDWVHNYFKEVGIKR